MKIPPGPRGTAAAGHPTLRVSMVRSFGDGGLDAPGRGLEEVGGCPRQFHERYITKAAPQTPSWPLAYGWAAHRALELAGQGSPVDEAVRRAVGECLAMEEYGGLCGRDDIPAIEADLEKWASSLGSTADLWVIASEVELVAPLDGRYWLAGRLDALAVDPEDPSVLYVVDYKTDRKPPDRVDVAANLQGRAYTMLAFANLDWASDLRNDMLGMNHSEFDRVVFAYDAVKWHAVEVEYSEEDLDVTVGFLAQLGAVIESTVDPKPILNYRCGWCPVRDSCPLWPEGFIPEAETALATRPTSALDEVSLIARNDWAEQVRPIWKALSTALDEIRDDTRTYVSEHGGLATGGHEFTWQPDATQEYYDPALLHAAFGDAAFEVMSVSKAAVEGWAGQSPTGLDAAHRCLARRPDPKMRKKRR